MKFFQKLKGAFVKSPQPVPEPLTREQIQERITDLDERIKSCKLETQIGTARTGEYAFRALAGFIPERDRLHKLLEQTDLQ